MPNIKSAKKRVVVSEKRNERKSAQKSAVRTAVKKARTAINDNAENKAEIVKAASVDLDKAAAKGLIHKNTAARKKSRLAKAANAAKD